MNLQANASSIPVRVNLGAVNAIRLTTEDKGVTRRFGIYCTLRA